MYNNKTQVLKPNSYYGLSSNFMINNIILTNFYQLNLYYKYIYNVFKFRNL